LRKSFLFVGVISMAAGSALAEQPFAPPTVVQPDYVATIGTYYKVTHHGDWTRVDRGSVNHTTEYFSSNGIAISKSSKGSLSFVRGDEPNYLSYDREPRNTGERRVYLGESCTVWDVWRSKPSRTGYQHSHWSCVTDDGIELWQEDVYGKKEPVRSAEAARIKRRPVVPEEVQPPRSLFTVDWWDRDESSSVVPPIPDHEIIMESSSASKTFAKSIRTIRTHGSWQFLEDTEDGRRRHLTIKSPEKFVRYTSDKSGEHQNLAFTVYDSPNPRNPASTAVSPRLPEDLDRSEVILGESCRWFDMTPGVADAGSAACRTDDGIVLKETRWSSLSFNRTWTATRLTRRPIAIEEVKPPADLLDPKLWRIE
jgi:hypothetical protein